MSKKDILLFAALFCIGILSRGPLVEHMQSHMDGPLFSIAVVRGFNFAQETPAPPGYPLYVAVGWLLYQLVHDPHKALLIESVLFSGIAAVSIYIAGKVIYNRIVGCIASLLFLSGSTFYFFGLTTYGYIMLAALTPLLATVVYVVFVQKQHKNGLLLGSIFALELAFRPQEVFFIFPLFALGVLTLPASERVKTFLSCSLLTFVWFLPYLSINGGLVHYLSVVVATIKTGALPPPTLSHALQRYMLLLQGLFLSFGLANVALLYYLMFLKRLSLETIYKNKHIVFFIVWILPGLLFNIFVRTEHAGYQLTYLCAVLLLIAYALARLALGRKFLIAVYTCVAVFVNLFVFFYNRDPLYANSFRQTSFHYTDIRRNDKEMSEKVAFIKKLSPEKALILMGPVFWRQTMYHLPEYQLYEIDALVTQEPRFMYLRRDARDWIRKEYISKEFSFVIPKNITTIVLFDNESSTWYKGTDKQVKHFGGSIQVTTIPVPEGAIVTYGYHSLQIHTP